MPLTFQVAIFTTPIYHAGMSGDGDGDGGRDDARSGFPRGAAAVISAGLLVASLGWPALLGRLPLGLFLKNQLGLGPADIAGFWAVGTVAWYAKPLAGLLCDGVPLFGSRRRAYLIIGGAAATALWAALGIVPHTTGALLALVVAINVALVIISAAVGGFLVELGQRHAATGRLSGLRLAIDGAVTLVAGPVGGWLAGRALGWTAVAGAAIALPLVPLALAFARDPAPPVDRQRPRARPRWAEVWRPAAVALRARTLWLVLVFIFVAYLPPGFQTALFFRQQDVLHMDPRTMGFLQLLGGVGALVGAAVYASVCRRFTLRVLLLGGIVLNVVSTAIYVRYDSLAAAQVITVIASVLGTLAILPYYDLATRAVPAGGESFGYALILSAQNIASFALSEPLGAALYSRASIGFTGVVWINTAATAAVILLVPLLPTALLARREGERA